MADHVCITLKRCKVGDWYWYECVECPQKFMAEKWDGKMEVVIPEPDEEVPRG